MIVDRYFVQNKAAVHDHDSRVPAEARRSRTAFSARPLVARSPKSEFAVQRLRRRLGWQPPARSPIESVRGFGYRYRGAGWQAA